MQPTRVGRLLLMLADSNFNGVTRGGQTWRYADSGDVPVVVLNHGFPDTPQSYAGIARALNDAGCRTIVPYLRGYHPITLVPGRPYDALHLAENAVGLLDALEVKSAVFVGHDWGPRWSGAQPHGQPIGSTALQGGQDLGGRLGPYKKSQGMLAGGAELFVMLEAGHWPHREEGSQFTDALMGF